MMNKVAQNTACKNPYVAQWQENYSGRAYLIKAQVRCDCGFSGPERNGVLAKEEAIEAWNQRNEVEQCQE